MMAEISGVARKYVSLSIFPCSFIKIYNTAFFDSNFYVWVSSYILTQKNEAFEVKFYLLSQIDLYLR